MVPQRTVRRCRPATTRSAARHRRGCWTLRQLRQQPRPQLAEAGWVIPAISAGASLLGTLVGGFSTYWTSKKSFERSLASEQSQQRNTLIREAAVRFISSVTETPLLATSLARIETEWKPAAAQLAAATTDEEFMAAAAAIDPGIPPDLDRPAKLIHLMRTSGVFDEDASRAVALLTELRLIVPRDVAEVAQRVVYSAAARELALATAPHIQRQATDSLNHEINEFFNRVRHHMNVEDIEFELFNQEVAQHVLKLS